MKNAGIKRCFALVKNLRENAKKYFALIGNTVYHTSLELTLIS